MKILTTNLLFYIARLIIKLLSYQPWALTVLTCVAFLIISWINLFNYNINFYSLEIFSPILGWLGIEENGTYGNEEILSFVAKTSFIFGVFGIAIELFLKKVFKYEFKSKKGLGFIVITVLFLSAVLSCFSSGAKEKGAISIIPVLVYFWIFAIVSYALYLLLDYSMKVIDERLKRKP